MFNEAQLPGIAGNKESDNITGSYDESKGTRKDGG